MAEVLKTIKFSLINHSLSRSILETQWSSIQCIIQYQFSAIILRDKVTLDLDHANCCIANVRSTLLKKDDVRRCLQLRPDITHPTPTSTPTSTPTPPHHRAALIIMLPSRKLFSHRHRFRRYEIFGRRLTQYDCKSTDKKKEENPRISSPSGHQGGAFVEKDSKSHLRLFRPPPSSSPSVTVGFDRRPLIYRSRTGKLWCRRESKNKTKFPFLSTKIRNYCSGQISGTGKQRANYRVRD